MAGLSIGKRDVQAMADVLDGDYETVEEAARAAMEFAFARYEEKAKFTIVGQAAYTPDGGWLSPENAAATKVALGRYGTEKAAINDALSFAIGSTGEQFKAWVLPVHHGTPASYFTKRKDAKKAVATVEVSQAEGLARSLREQNGWITDEELAERQSEREHCPECGASLVEADALAGGYEVKP